MVVLMVFVCVYLAAGIANIIKLKDHIDAKDALLLVFIMPIFATFVSLGVLTSVMETIVNDKSCNVPLHKKVVTVLYAWIHVIPQIFTSISITIVKCKRDIKHPYKRTINNFKGEIKGHCNEVFA